MKMKLSGIDPPLLVPLLAADLPPFPPPQAAPAEKKMQKAPEGEKKQEEKKNGKEKEGIQLKEKKEKKPEEVSSSSSPSPSPSVPGTPAEEVEGIVEASTTTPTTGRALRKKSREERRGPRDREKEKEYAAMREKLFYMSKVTLSVPLPSFSFSFSLILLVCKNSYMLFSPIMTSTVSF